MITTRTTTGLLVFVSAAALAAAQAPQNPDPRTAPRPNPQAPAPTAAAGQTTMTLTGCLYREAQVPGRTPNVAERAGVLEDYILADARVAGGAARSGAAGATGTSGSTPTTGSMYKVENIPDERLKALVGKRVEVMGRIDAEGAPQRDARGGAPAGGPTADRGLGPDQINLPEFEAASIREVEGTCPATPAAAKPAQPAQTPKPAQPRPQQDPTEKPQQNPNQ